MLDARDASARSPGIGSGFDRVSTAPLLTGSGHGSVTIPMLGTVALPEARRLEARALEAVRRGHRRVAVDLTAVSAIDAGLIGALLRIRRGLTPIDGELTLIIDGPPARELVRTTGLDTLSHISTKPGSAPPVERGRAPGRSTPRTRPLPPRSDAHNGT